MVDEIIIFDGTREGLAAIIQNGIKSGFNMKAINEFEVIISDDSVVPPKRQLTTKQAIVEILNEKGIEATDIDLKLWDTPNQF